jgi:transposase
MLHLQKGKKMQEVSEIVQQSRMSIHNWLNWLSSEGGVERLIGFVKGRGRRSKLSFMEDEEIRASIEELREKRSGGRVTGEEIQRMIQEKWGVSYALSSIYVLLKRLKIVWITSRSQHPQADIAVQEDFKKTFLKK